MKKKQRENGKHKKVKKDSEKIIKSFEPSKKVLSLKSQGPLHFFLGEFEVFEASQNATNPPSFVLLTQTR